MYDYIGTNTYQAMQPALFKLIPALDSSFLRRRLKAVLENPKYSMEQLKFAAPPQAKQTTYQETHTLPISPLLRDSQALQNSSEEIKLLETRIQQLTKNTASSSSFFNKHEASNNHSSLKAFRSMA